MGEPEHGVLPCAPGGVPGKAVVEHVDQANLRVPLQRLLHRGRRDRLVVGRFDLPDGLALDELAVDTSAPPVDAPAADGAARPVTVSAIGSGGDTPAWPYGVERPAAPAAIHRALPMIPFYARAHRGSAAMRVFLPESLDADQRDPH